MVLKSRHNKITGLLCAALASLAILGAGAGTAWAYFTSYAVTDGTYPVAIGDKVIMTEEFSRWTKHVRLTADESSGPVYVRARAFYSDSYGVDYSVPDGGWFDGGDGWYYYGEILYASQATAELTVSITGVPDEITDPLDFGVAVVYESTPVRYRADGTAYADWGRALEGKEAAYEQDQ